MNATQNMASIVAETTGILVVVLDPQARITYFNRACEELTGYSGDEVVGRFLWDLLPERYVAPVKQGFKELVGCKQPSRFEAPWLTTGGEERWIAWSINLTTDAQGRVTQVVGTGVDITERKRVHEELQHSRRFIETIFNSVHDSISVIDTSSFRIAAVNSTFLDTLNREEKDVIGKRCYEVTHDRSTVCEPPDGICPLRETMRTGHHSSSEHTHYDKDGKAIYVEVSTHPMRNERGEIHQVVHVARDITERKQAEEELRRSEHALRKRVKELSCLYDISVILSGAEPLAETLTEVAGRLPQAWQYPEVARAEITFDGETYSSGDGTDAVHCQASSIVVNGKGRGEVKVCYVEDRPVADEGPFLREERFLLDTVAEHLAKYVVRVELARERDEIQERLRESEELYRGLDELSGMAIIRLDREGRRTFVNDHAVRIYGRSKEDLLAGRYGDTIVPEENRRRRERLFRKAMETGEPWLGSVFQMMVRGQVRHMLSNWMPIKDAEGNVVGMQTTTTDITERVEMEERLRQSEEFFRGVAESGQVGIVRLDVNGRRTYVNGYACRLSGKSSEALLSGAFGDTLAPEEREKARQAFRQVVETGTVRNNLVCWYETPAGRRCCVETLVPIKDAQGRVEAVQSTFVDITPLIETQERLRRSEELYRGVVELTDAGVVRFDLEGRRTFVNEAFVNRYGKPAEELLKGTVGDRRVPEDREKARKLFRRCVESGKPIKGMIARHEMNGRTLYTRANYSPIFDSNGKVTGVQATSVDITELVEAREHLHQRTQELEALFNIASILGQPWSFEEKATRALEVLAHVAQVDRVILRLSDEAEEGLRLVATAGPKVQEVAPNPLQAYGDGITGLAFQKREPVLANDYPSHPRARPESVAHGVKSALALPIEADGRLLGTLSLDSWEPDHFTQGRVKLVTAVAKEIGSLLEKAGLMEARRQSEELYRSLVEATGSVVVRVDREGRRTFVGGDTMGLHGRSAEDLKAGRFGDNDIPEDRERAWALLRETFETGKPVRGFVTRQKAGRGVRYKTSNWEPIKDAEGNVVEVQTTSTDITDQIEAERRRMEAQHLEALAAMAGGIAHDVNNVLAMVMLWANIGQVHTDRPEVREAMENVMKAAQDGAETMRRLRRFIEPRKAGKREQVDLKAIAQECIEFTRPMWKDQSEARDIYIEVREELGEAAEIIGTAAELREAVVNLIRNAIEAMPGGGTLTVRTYREGDRACLAVSDTGVGIREDDLTRIFDPFYSTKGGSGLGLSTVRAIVAAHDGEIDVESVEGEGATFVVSFPITKQDTQVGEEPEQPSRQAGLPGGLQCNILVVDDEPLVREALENVLKREGHRVVAAEDGGAALKAFGKEDFDIVFLDLGLPKMNGYRVAEEMKKLKSHVPIILVTGWADDVDQERVESIGAAGVVGKPFRPQDLLRTLAEAIAHAKGGEG